MYAHPGTTDVEEDPRYTKLSGILQRNCECSETKPKACFECILDPGYKDSLLKRIDFFHTEKDDIIHQRVYGELSGCYTAHPIKGQKKWSYR